MNARMPVTLLYTNSFDGTADLVVQRVGSESVFRFNFDLWRDYSIRIDDRDVEISNPTGRVVRSADIAKVYWRKPVITRELFPEKPITDEDAYLEEEIWYAMRDAVSAFERDGKVVLVEPFAEQRIGKLIQLRMARDLFHVPPWKFVRGSQSHLAQGRESVVKSLTLKRVAHASVLYAARVPEGELDPSAPWLVQDYVDAVKDVTVVFVRGDLFAFELPRSFLERSIDWREVSLEKDAAKWTPHALPANVIAAIRTYQQRLRLDYGRLDFLLRADGGYAFLEVNPSGEWGWLDPDGRHGVLDAILREVSPLTPCHAIPRG